MERQAEQEGRENSRTQALPPTHMLPILPGTPQYPPTHTPCSPPPHDPCSPPPHTLCSPPPHTLVLPLHMTPALPLHMTSVPSFTYHLFTPIYPCSTPYMPLFHPSHTPIPPITCPLFSPNPTRPYLSPHLSPATLPLLPVPDLPQVPYPRHTVLSSGVHEMAILIETQTRHILGHPLKHVDWARLR